MSKGKGRAKDLVMVGIPEERNEIKHFFEVDMKFYYRIVVHRFNYIVQVYSFRWAKYLPVYNRHVFISYPALLKHG